MYVPLFRLAGLGIRQLGKPLAEVVKRRASKDQRFKRSIISMAQKFHLLNAQMHSQLHPHHSEETIKPLQAEQAVQVAANLIGETVVFMVGSVAVTLEVTRSSMAEARKEEVKEKRYQALEDRVRELEAQVHEFRQWDKTAF